MQFSTDENGDYILDENGNKIEYTVEYENYKESIHINNEGSFGYRRQTFGHQRWSQFKSCHFTPTIDKQP